MNLKRYPNPVDFGWVFMCKLSAEFSSKIYSHPYHSNNGGHMHLDFMLVLEIIYFWTPRSKYWRLMP